MRTRAPSSPVVLAAVAGLLAPLVAAGPAAAFQCTRAGDTGPSLFWQDRTVTLQRSGQGNEVTASDIDRVLQASADTWNEVGCTDAVIQIGPPTTDRVVGFDWASGAGSPANHDIVVFRNDDPQDPVDAWEHQQSALAITTVTFESHEGRLLDADVEVNDAGFVFSACDPDQCDVRFDLQNTLTHEFGHVLGLDHSDVGEATMFPSAPEGDLSKRTLADDDIAGVCTIYPAGQPAGDCYPSAVRTAPPRVRFTPTVCGAGGGAAPVVVLALLGAARIAGRRRRFARLPRE